jgi:hypothetical protein
LLEILRFLGRLLLGRQLAGVMFSGLTISGEIDQKWAVELFGLGREG